jgi:hypothetical protein
MYIVWGNNIFAHELTLVRFARRIEQPSAGAHHQCRIASRAIAQRRRQLECDFTISRAKEYQQIEASLSV